MIVRAERCSIEICAQNGKIIALNSADIKRHGLEKLQIIIRITAAINISRGLAHLSTVQNAGGLIF